MIMVRKLALSAACLLFSSGYMYAQSRFAHPGLLHSASDFDLVRERLSSNDPVAVQSLDDLRNAPPVRGNWGGNWAVNETIIRGVSGDNYMNAYRNAARAYQCALLWKLTGEEGYGDVAIDVLNAYRMYNKALGGNSNISLIPGFIGYQLLNAAEIMRDYPKWSSEDIELFKQYMIDVWFTVAQDFLERRHDTVVREGNWYHYHSNWGQGNALFCISLGVFCDLPDIYNYGMYWLKEGPGNESLYVGRTHPLTNGQGLCGFGWGQLPWFHKDDRGPLGYLCQTQESGRDQGHAMAALGLMSYGLQTAYNQGDNAFCNLNNILVKGKAGSAMVAGAAEYVAMFNSMDNNIPEEAEIISSIPYKTNWWMTGLNWTGQGQWRPIWQLFINHYQNRMGIPMQYCTKMKNKIGIERGGGSYGNNSGGYDHTGFGDLMHNDAPVTADKVPTILFPVITINGNTVREYAEYKDIEPGTVVMLSANLPEGESDSGKWEWEDGVSGNNRQLTVDHSGLYRLYYTNSHGVRSVQLFSLSVRGEGIRGTLSHTVTYNGETNSATEVSMGVGRSLTMTTAYTNWNYIESEKWYDEEGRELGSGGSYTYTQTDTEDHRLIFRLTNQSGVVIEKVLEIKYDSDDLTSSLPDPQCDDLSLWDTDHEGFKNVSGQLSTLGGKYIQASRPSSEGGLTCWGLPAFRISQRVSGLRPGKYELGASLIATQQGKTGESSRSHVKDVWLYANGASVPVSTLDGVAGRFKVSFWVGDDGVLDFGVENLSDQDRGYSSSGMNFFAMDDYSLEYKGTDGLSSDYALLRDSARSVGPDDVPSGVYEALESALENSTPGLSDMVTLQQALGDAGRIMARYGDYHPVYEQIRSYAGSGEVTDASLTSALSSYASSTDSRSYYRAYDSLVKAWDTVLPTVPAAVDVSWRLRNRALQPSPSDMMYDYGTGWDTDADGGNFRVFAIDGSDAQRGDAEGANMIERFCTGNFFDNQNLIYQRMSGLPSGRYVFRASAQRGADQGSIVLFANGSSSCVLSNKVLKGSEVSSDVTDGILSVGLKSSSGNGCQWVSLADPRLEYHSPVQLLGEAIAEASSLDYGTDTGGALSSALSSARSALSSGDASQRMSAYSSLVSAISSYRLANASSSHPYDMTSSVKNPDFNLRNTSSWVLTGGGGNYPAYNQGVMEFWHVAFDLSQSLTDLPAGNYRISVQGRSDRGESNRSFSLYAQSGATVESAYITGQTRADGTDAGLHLSQNADDLNADSEESRQFVTLTVAGGILKIGVKCTDASTWCVLDNFRLEYLGADAGDLMKKWNEQCAVADAMDKSLLPSGIRDALLSARGVDVSGMGVDELTSSLSVLMSAISEAQSSVSLYAGFMDLVSVTEAMADNSVPNLAATLNVFRRAIETAVSNVDKLTEAVGITKEYETLEKARQTYAVGAVPVNGISFDMTFLLTNPDLTDLPEWTQQAGWYTDVDKGIQCMHNSDVASADGKDAFYEIYAGSRTPMPEGNILYQKTVLAPGTYLMSAYAFGKGANDNYTGDFSGCFFAGQEKGDAVTAARLTSGTVKFVLSEEQEIKLGLYSDGSGAANWAGIGYMKLYKLSSDDLILNEEDQDLKVKEDTYADVVIYRKLKTGSWNTFCVPFAMTAEQLADNKIYEVRKLESTAETGSSVVLNFSDPVSAIEAGVPYIVKVSEDISQIRVNDVTVKAADPVVLKAGHVGMQGNYGWMTITGYDKYFISNNSFYRAADKKVTVKGYRAYITMDLVASGVNQMLIDIDGNLTAIEDILGEDTDITVNVYTIDGVCVKSGVKSSEALDGLRKGIYIVNGRKVIK